MNTTLDELSKRYIVTITAGEDYLHPSDLREFFEAKVTLKVRTHYKGKTGVYQLETNSKNQYQEIKEFLDKREISYTIIRPSRSS